MERFYKVSEVAKILKVSYKTVYNWISMGYLKAVKAEKAVRVPESAIIEFVETNLTTPFITPYKRKDLIKNLVKKLDSLYR